MVVSETRITFTHKKYRHKIAQLGFDRAVAPAFLKLDDGHMWVLTTILPRVELSICRMMFRNQSPSRLTLLEQTSDCIRLCVRHNPSSVELTYRLASCEEERDFLDMPVLDVQQHDDDVCGCVVG